MRNSEVKNTAGCTSKESAVKDMQFILQARPYLELESYKVTPEVLTGGGCPLFSFAKSDLDGFEITDTDGEGNVYNGFSVEFAFRNKCSLPDETALAFEDDVQMIDHNGEFLWFKDVVPEQMKPMRKEGDREVIKAWFYVEKINAEEEEEMEAAEKEFREKYSGKEEVLNIQVEATNGFVREAFHTDFPMIFDGKEHKVENFRKYLSEYWVSGEKYKTV